MGMYEQLLLEKAKREKARRQEAITGTPDIIEETHDDVSFADRAIVKNLSSSPEKSARYLAKNNPQLDTRVWDGRVLVKSKGAKKWNALDPDTGMFSSDILGDVADIGYDVASGVGQAMALPAGGIVGSGIAGGVAEAARQGLGSIAGIEDNIDVGDIALSGTIGAAVPAIGKAAAPIAKKVTAKALEKAPKVLSKIGLQSEEQIRTLRDSVGDLKLMEEKGVTPFIENIKDETENVIENITRQAGQQVDEVISAAPDVNIAPVKKALSDRIDELEGIMQRSDTAANRANHRSAVEAYNKHFAILDENGIPLEEVPDMMNAKDAWKMQQNMRGESKSFNMKNEGFSSRHRNADSVATQQTANAFQKAEKGINKALADVTGGKSSVVKKLYAKQKELEKMLKPAFKSPKKLHSTLKNLRKEGSKIDAEMLAGVDKKHGTRLVDASNKIDMEQTFGKGAKNLEGLNTVSITQQTPLSKGLGAIGGILGWKGGSAQGALAGSAAGQALGKKLSSPKAIRSYIEKLLRSDKYVRVMDKKTKDYLREELYKKLTKGDALREAIKASQKASEDRG